jgi:hypothetical protein
MVLSRLPIAVAPAQQETVASYLARLANLHGLPLRELWEPISLARPGGRRRDVLADRLAVVTATDANISSGRCPSCIPRQAGRRCAISPSPAAHAATRDTPAVR